MRLKRRIVDELRKLSLGDLVRVEWCDASVGKSLGSGVAVDVPVKSWGIFIGVLGQKSKHIVLAQNTYCYSDRLFDIDYTSIPLAWTISFCIITKASVECRMAEQLVNSFIRGGRTRFETRAYHHNYYQKRVKNHV